MQPSPLAMDFLIVEAMFTELVIIRLDFLACRGGLVNYQHV